MSLGEYNGAGSGTTKLLVHLNGNSNDSSGNANNGTDTNITYSLANGKLGQGAGFNGSSSLIDYGNPASLQITGALTVSFWVKFNNLGNVVQIPFSKWRDSSDYSWLFAILGTSFYWVISSNGNATGNKDVNVPNSTFSTGVWYNLVGTFTPSTSIVLYCNGSVLGTNTSSIPASIYNANVNVAMGVSKDNSNGWNYFFDGYIDEGIIENTAWSAEKVKKYYTYTKGRFGIL